MRIAICDDDIHELAAISTLIEGFKKTEELSLTYEVFNSPKSLLNKVRNQDFDLLLLDVIMPEMTGIELASTIRTFDAQIPIIFLTTSPEFALASYRVHAKDYLLKPVDASLLYESLMQQYKPDEAFLVIKTADELMQLPLSQIVHLEVSARKLNIHLTDSTILQPQGTLSEYEDILLHHPQFCKPHRSYIVNLQYITKLTKDGIHTTTDVVIPIPKASFAKTKNEYMNFLMQ